MTKAIELFITELAMRAWGSRTHVDERASVALMLMREDVVAAADSTPHFDFLCVVLVFVTGSRA